MNRNLAIYRETAALVQKNPPYDEHRSMLVNAKEGNWPAVVPASRNLRGRAFIEASGALAAQRAAQANRANAATVAAEGLGRWKAMRKTKKGRRAIARTLVRSGRVPEVEQLAAYLTDGFLEFAQKKASAKAPREVMRSAWAWIMDVAAPAYYAGVLADAQHLALRGGVLSLRSLHTEVLEQSKQHRQQAQRALASMQAELAAGDRDGLERHCTATITSLESRQRELSHLAALVARARSDAQARNGARSEEAWAKLGLDVADTVRQAVFTYLVAYYHLMTSVAEPTSRRWQVEQRLAATLRHQSVVPDGRNVSVANLAKEPQQHDGAFVEFSGFVENVRVIAESETKRTSVFEVTDRVREESVSITLPFGNVATAGLVNGCYVRLSGTVYQSAADDQWRVRLDRLNAAEYAKQSWIDAMTRRVEQWFQRHPGALNLSYTFEPATATEEMAGSHELYSGRPTFVRSRRR